jgi:nicotinamide phosphoribosyltransferase
MYKLLPENTEYVYSYIESRGGKWDQTLFFGLQAYIKEYLSNPITQEEIEYANKFITQHGLPFNKEGWEYILEKHNGYLPIRINAVPEGTVVPTHNVLVTIENTDPNCYWLTTFLETSLLRSVWYGTTIATNSWVSKKILKKWAKKNGNIDFIDNRFVDFGFRGVSSYESASIGGAAHLINFTSTDNISGILFADQYYDSGMVGYSVQATEHSVSCAWGKDKEKEYIFRMLDQLDDNHKIVSLVGDSYNIFGFCQLLGEDPEIKNKIIDNGKRGGFFVVRPDSGKPSKIVETCLKILDEYFGHTLNEKGYKILNHVRILQGDGIDHETIEEILYWADVSGFSSDNIIFGSGGKLLQDVTRDTLKFAMKCSAIKVNGEWQDVFKDPYTDPGKTSKKGRVTLYKENGRYYSGVEDWPKSELITVYENGKLLVNQTFEEIRNRSNEC